MKNNEIMAKDLLERYPNLSEMKPPFSLELYNRRINVAFYSKSLKSIKTLKAEGLCKRRDAFSTDISNNLSAIYIRDGLGKQYMLKCIVHETGHILNEHYAVDRIYENYIDPELEQKEEAEANDFEACYQRLLQQKESTTKASTRPSILAENIFLGTVLIFIIYISTALILDKISDYNKVLKNTVPIEQEQTTTQPETDTYVYAISYNHQYHKIWCRHISHVNPEDFIKMTRDKAIRELGERGACGNCHPLED